MKQKKSNAFWATAAVAVFAAAIGIALLGYSRGRIKAAPHLGMLIKQGARFRNQFINASTVDGRRVQLQGKWDLLLYSQPTDDDGLRRLRYADTLWKEYRGRNFTVTGILPGSREDLTRVAHENMISYPLILDDGDWLAWLGLSGSPYALVLVNPSGEIEFASPTSTLENMRQLVEKALNGAISYGSEEGGFYVGARLPGVRLVNVRTGEGVSLDSLVPGYVALVSPECAGCALHEYISSYTKFRSSGAVHKPKLVFSAKFNREEIGEQVSKLHIGEPVYLAAARIPGLEDKAFQSTVGTGGVVLDVDAASRVRSISSWDDFVRGAQEYDGSQQSGESPGRRVVEPKRLSASLKMVPMGPVIEGGSMINAFKPLAGGHVVADGRNNRLLVIASDGTLSGQIGSIGQKTGELFEMRDIAVGRNGRLYVIDAAGRRLQIFDQRGAVQARVDFSTVVSGLCIEPTGQIVVGTPQAGRLLSVYDESGRLVKSFGELKRTADLWGPATSRAEERRTALNRVRLACDGSGNIYAAFVGAPFIQKYDQTARLVFERRLAGERVAAAVGQFRERGRAPVAIGFRDESEYTPLFTTGITLDEPKGIIYLALYWRQPWVQAVGLDQGGDLRAEWDIQADNVSARNAPWSIEIDPDSDRLVGTDGVRLWTTAP